MSTVTLTRGIPGSGKTTWAKAWAAENPESRVRVNRDDLRYEMFGTYWGPEIDEDQVSMASDLLVERAIAEGKDVTLDNTHVKPGVIEEMVKFAGRLGAQVEVIDFPVDVEEAIRRDRARIAAGERGVGFDPAIRSMDEMFANRVTPPLGVIHRSAPHMPARVVTGLPLTNAEKWADEDAMMRHHNTEFDKEYPPGSPEREALYARLAVEKAEKDRVFQEEMAVARKRIDERLAREAAEKAEKERVERNTRRRVANAAKKASESVATAPTHAAPAHNGDQPRNKAQQFQPYTNSTTEDAALPVDATSGESASDRARREAVIFDVTSVMDADDRWAGEVELLNAAVDDPALLPDAVADIVGFMDQDTNADWSEQIGSLRSLISAR